jgi:hypothetical protein
MFWTICYRVQQIVAPTVPLSVDGSVITFPNGVQVDLDHASVTGGTSADRAQVRILGPRDAERVESTFRSSPMRPVLDITELNEDTIRYATHDGSAVVSGGGSFSLNIGDPAGPGGVQAGHGNVQVNRYARGDRSTPPGWQVGDRNHQDNSF